MRRGLAETTCGTQQQPSGLLGRLLKAVLAVGLAGTAAKADDWPQWLGPQRDGVWRETGILDTFPPDGPKTRWRTPIGGGYAGPAVALGRVYLTDRILADVTKNSSDPFAKNLLAGQERVLCLDAATGTVLWKHVYECAYEVSYPAGPRATP